MPGDSQILRLGHLKHGNETQIRLWEDKWLGNLSFQEQYPNLYNIMRKKKATIDSLSEQHLADGSKGYISLHENRLHSLIYLYSSVARNITVLYSLVPKPMII
jgi:hypothetical protein